MTHQILTEVRADLSCFLFPGRQPSFINAGLQCEFLYTIASTALHQGAGLQKTIPVLFSTTQEKKQKTKTGHKFPSYVYSSIDISKYES